MFSCWALNNQYGNRDTLSHLLFKALPFAIACVRHALLDVLNVHLLPFNKATVSVTARAEM